MLGRRTCTRVGARVTMDRMSLARLDTPDALLERADELWTLGECLETVRRSSRGQVLLLGGEAGVGKTTLLRRFCDESSAPARVLWGACDPLFTPRPLGPLLAIGHESSGALGEAVESAMPYEVMTALVDELRARAPAVFVLEDAHWADEATLDVFRLLARRVETVPALVVVSYRDDELDAAHPLRLVLGELGTARSITRLKLGRLSSDAVAQLAQPYQVDAAELYRKTAGNPFFVVEALAAGDEGIPNTIRDAVLARAARLSPDARALLDAVAIVPQHAELWLLDALAGEAVGGLDECLASGMLRVESPGVTFRHELARLAVEESVAPYTKIELHRRALAALADPPVGVPDVARLAHHAEAAGDGDAVLRFAPAAAERAASLGSHREAAAQYARALRFGDGLSLDERADLLERRSQECYVTDEHDAATVAIREAIECRRKLGEPVDEARALRWLSKIVFCPGHDAESEQAARDAAALVEGIAPGRELAAAYADLAETFMHLGQGEDALIWGRRALDLAERFGDTESAVHAQITIATCEPPETGRPKLEQCLEAARRSGHPEEMARAYGHLVGGGIGDHRLDVARRYLEPAIEHCTEHGYEHQRYYLLAYRAHLELEEGRWSEATDSVQRVLCLRRTSIAPRIWALAVLGLVRARRGDPEYQVPLDEAWSLAGPTGGDSATGDMWRAWTIATARAEVAWLDGDREAMHSATDLLYPVFVEQGWGWVAGELAYWRRRIGIDEPTPAGIAEPYALQLAGEWARAAALWRELGFPYEAALALADADDEEPLRQALEELQALGARRTAGVVARTLRERGVRGLPRGPRPRTRQNPAGLTSRELEVLVLLAEGLRNSDIAGRLVLSERTVGHHVGAVLRKLNVRTRGEASAEAYRLGLAGQPR
jgi:DNA-binding CsgD family transcriptional regulator/tetratricopeptide (TPR) repeat protein